MEDKSLDKRIEIAQRIADFHKAKKPIQELDRLSVFRVVRQE